MTGVAKNTILKLLVEIGAACSRYLDVTMRGLKCERLQADEAWSFCYAKQKNVKPEHFEDGGYAGDVWAWVAIDADTKLIPSWLLGKRDAGSAMEFIQDLASRLANRVQLTTDGLKVYINAVYDAFGENVDYSVLHKIYGRDMPDSSRYSPAACIGCEKKPVIGNPDMEHASTSYIERQNLTMRMSMRRFTRLTNGFSKKLENHSASVALYMMYYNFGRKHKTLGTTPAVKAGLTDHVWTVEEIIGLLQPQSRKLLERRGVQTEPLPAIGIEGSQGKVLQPRIAEADGNHLNRRVPVFFNGFPERERFGFECFQPELPPGCRVALT